jgi:hypothetical protein
MGVFEVMSDPRPADTPKQATATREFCRNFATSGLLFGRPDYRQSQIRCMIAWGLFEESA